MDMEYARFPEPHPLVTELTNAPAKAFLPLSPDEIATIISDFDNGNLGTMGLPSGEKEGDDHDQP